MGYYHIELSDKYKELCTIVTQWIKYEYQRLPMGLCNSPDIFRENISEHFVGLDTVHVYIAELLNVTKGSWTEHVNALEYMLICLQKDRLKVNARKSCFGAHKFDYLGYHVTREGVMPIPKKVEAIQDLAVPKTRKQLRQFIGMINFYHDMWQKGDAILNITHVANWEHIQQHKKLQINHDNKRESMRRNNHQYKVGDTILFKRKKNCKHALEFMGPSPITQIYDNITVCFQKGIINDATNIHRIKPFFD